MSQTGSLPVAASSVRHPLWIRAMYAWGDLKNLEMQLRAAGLTAVANDVTTSLLYANRAVVTLQGMAPKAGAS